MKRYLPLLLVLALVGCNDESGATNSCETICADAQTLLKCTPDGPVGENCIYGCENSACKPAPACVDSCKNADTLFKCTATGRIEEACPNGCENGACKAAPACVDSCKNADTLLKCTADGPVEEACPNGCEDGACKPAPACVDSCKNADTLLKCTADGPVEEACPNGCEDGACKAAPACEVSCKDGNTLSLCDDDGKAVEKTCKAGCENGACKAVYGEAPKTCNANSDAVCLTETTSYICSDWWNQEGGYDLFTHHCAGNRTCMDGDCIVADVTKCASDYCKDFDTLVECQNGMPVERACGEGNLCIERACRPSALKTCRSDGDCAEAETCYQNFCYLKSNMAIKVGDPCDSATFQEYCKGDIEYKCGYEDTVETNDCSGYNGCSTLVKQAYQTHAPIFNAICRGTTENLSACTQPGVVLNRCYNVDDPYFAIHFSLASVCVRGSDGRMIYLTDSEETDCGNYCDESTGLCPEK